MTALQIEEGRFYQRADGSVHGPAQGGVDSHYPWIVGGSSYQDSGRFYWDQPHQFDLVAEVADPAHPVDVAAQVAVEQPAWAAAVENEAVEDDGFVTREPVYQHVETGWDSGGFYEKRGGLKTYVTASASEYAAKLGLPDPLAPSVRQFSTGAKRDQDVTKFDFEGFLSPTVLNAYAAYMHKNRQMADGSLRDSDNWQKGIPANAYMKSMWRHFFDVWAHHRGADITHEDLEAALCGLLFNAMGYLHEQLKKDA